LTPICFFPKTEKEKEKEKEKKKTYPTVMKKNQ
jgi:hypothetical protein